jgi:hypothetical protein
MRAESPSITDGPAYVGVGVVAPAPVVVYRGGYYYRRW